MQLLQNLLTLVPVLAVLIFPFVFRNAAGPSAHQWKALGVGILTVVLGTILVSALSGISLSLLSRGRGTTAEVQEAGAYGWLVGSIVGFLGGLWLSSALALWLQWRVLKSSAT